MFSSSSLFPSLTKGVASVALRGAIVTLLLSVESERHQQLMEMLANEWRKKEINQKGFSNLLSKDPKFKESGRSESSSAASAEHWTKSERITVLGAGGIDLPLSPREKGLSIFLHFSHTRLDVMMWLTRHI